MVKLQGSQGSHRSGRLFGTAQTSVLVYILFLVDMELTTIPQDPENLAEDKNSTK